MTDASQEPRPTFGNGITLREWMAEKFDGQQRALEMLADTTAREAKVLKDGVERVAELHADAHAREHNLNQTAINKAETSMEHRLSLLTATLDERFKLWGERYERDHNALDEQIAALQKSASHLEGRMWGIGGAITFAFAAITIGMRFLL